MSCGNASDAGVAFALTSHVCPRQQCAFRPLQCLPVAASVPCVPAGAGVQTSVRNIHNMASELAMKFWLGCRHFAVATAEFALANGHRTSAALAEARRFAAAAIRKNDRNAALPHMSSKLHFCPVTTCAVMCKVPVRSAQRLRLLQLRAGFCCDASLHVTSPQTQTCF